MRGWVLVLAVGGLLLAPIALGQASQPSETMKLTDQAPAQAPSGSGPLCNQAAVHGLAMPGQGPQQAGAAYTSTSSVAAGCPTLFRTPSPGAFNLTGPTNVHLFIGCDDPTVLHQPLNNVRVWLVKNGGTVGESRANVGPTCSPDQPIEVEVSIDQPDDNRVNATDTVGIDVTVFGTPNAVVDNIHVIVGGNETASTVTMPGISDALASDEADEAQPANASNTSLGSTNGSETGAQATGDDQNGTPGPGALGLGTALIAATALRRARKEP